MNDMRLLVFIFCLCLIFQPQLPVYADDSLPKEVSAFIAQRDTCDHFRGEPYEGGDHTEIGRERYKYVTGKLEEYCTGTDKTLADLRQKYSENPSVIEKLSMYDDKIE